MFACQSIVENIRNLVANYGLTGDEPTEPLAESYMAACKEVNSRLLRCSQLIRGGNLSEAVRLAEIEPPLLETYALLDFPERLQWAELTRLQQLPVPPPLFEELAREVNDAFAAIDPLQPLLKKHRLLALARAPLAQRIALLREMVFMEPENHGWKADLLAYEKLRFRTLEQEITEAITAKNVFRMSELLQELESQNWTLQLPEKLVAALRQTLRTESQRGVLVELRQTAEKLTQAAKDENIELGIKLADRWYAQTKLLGGSIPIDLNVEIQTPLDWVEEQRRYRDRVQYFEEQLDNFRNHIQAGLGTEQMAERFAAIEAVAEDIGRTIPESITHLYHSRMESGRIRGIRQFRVFLVVLVLLGLTLGSGMVLAMLHYRNQNETQKIASTLQGYLDRKDYDTANQYVEELKKKSEKILDSPGVAEVYAELRTAIDGKNEREILFRTSLDKVRETLKSGEPDMLALSQAETRAWTDSEKFELRTTKEEIRNFQAERQRQSDLALQTKLDAIKVAVSRLEPQKGRETDVTLAQLDELLKQALETRKLEGASTAVLNSRDLLIGQLEQWVGEIKQRKESRGDFSDLTQAVSSPDAYARTLKNLVTKYPNLPQSKDFQTLLEEHTIWGFIAQWNDVVNLLPGERGNQGINEGVVAKSEKIRKFLGEWNQKSSRFTGFPDHAAVEFRIPYYRAMEERNNRGESILFGLEKQMLQHKALPLWLYYDKKEDIRYYLPQEPQGERIWYLADRQGEKRTFRISDAALLATITEAPHVRFAKLAAERMEKIDQSDGKSWAETACILLQNLQDDPKFDPFLKYVLMKDLIEKFGAGDLSVRKGYAKHLAILNEAEPDETVDWVNPKSGEAEYQRKITKAVLDRLPSSASAVAVVRAEVRAYRAHTIGTFERIGWAEKTDNGSWICNTNRASLPREGFFVVRGTVSEEGDAVLRFEAVQILDEQKKTITATPGLLFGSPILLRVIF
ncbi:MAG: hypothetical protein FWC43_03135 [Planctomycetaceae bacterium]|nr:hypothetical protein [Planctomycetaceae bacterium]